MKKFFAMAFAALCLIGGSLAFADDVDDLLAPKQDTLTRTIVPEDQHVTNKTAKVWLEYTPITDEVRAYYTVLAVSFDQGEAMNTVLECLRDFQVQNQYLKYKYLRKDSVKYSKDDNNMRWATYSSQVKFSR